MKPSVNETYGSKQHTRLKPGVNETDVHAESIFYGSPSPFFPFFLAGSASRGRVAGGGGVSTLGVATSGFGCGFAGPSSSALGGGGRVICSSLGSVVLAGNSPSSSSSSASAASCARSAASSR